MPQKSVGQRRSTTPVKYFKELYGEKDLSVMAIGPAGENQIKYAAWINENDRASGRGGTGTIGGAKNLKAVVIKAEQRSSSPLQPIKTAWKEARSQSPGEESWT
jgi:aldehyde:ferredoxin oxidoreductase